MFHYGIQVYTSTEEFQRGLNSMAEAGWTLDSWQEVSEPDSGSFLFVAVYRMQK